jgi:excisionase family DNA binding protein
MAHGHSRQHAVHEMRCRSLYVKDAAGRWRNVVLSEARTKAQARELAADLALKSRRQFDGRSRCRPTNRFEPVAFGFGDKSEQFPRDPQSSLSVVSPRQSDPARALPSRSIPADHGIFGAPVVHGNVASRGVKSYLLTVREVASLLRVCRATIYSLCERGQLAHTRVGTSIRIHYAAVELLLRPARVTDR